MWKIYLIIWRMSEMGVKKLFFEVIVLEIKDSINCDEYKLGMLMLNEIVL